MVVICPFTIPKVSTRTLATGARQFVVQEALETTLWLLGPYLSSLTPITIVRSSPFAGAAMMTFLGPAGRCALAFSASVTRLVHPITDSTFRVLHGSGPGSV